MKIYKLTLRQPWWGAWKQFGWDKGVPGFGIAKDKLMTNDMVEVHLNGLKYLISSQEALQLAQRYNSYFVTKTGIKLVSIPKTAFKSI